MEDLKADYYSNLKLLSQNMHLLNNCIKFVLYQVLSIHLPLREFFKDTIFHNVYNYKLKP